MPTMLPLQPSHLGKMNERQVLRQLQSGGPMSRAEVARRSGLSAPTVSKAVASLLRTGLLEEDAEAELSRGRPAKRLRLATAAAQVLGVVVDVERCEIVSSGFDGALHDDREAFDTPDTYEALIDEIESRCRTAMARPGVVTLGLGVSLPGLIDYRRQRGVLSPNVPMTDGRSPGRDLSQRLGVECAMVQESHALCLAERAYGNARGMDDFAMLDLGSGIGLGVVSGGRLLTGHSGLAGEIGHITVVPDGRQCGCGNRGCLETVASDASVAWRVSKRLGRRVSIDWVIERSRSRMLNVRAELDEAGRFLAVGVAAVLNLFNPAALFLHGRLFEADDALFARVLELTRKRALPPAFAECRIVLAKGSKRQGAVAGIVQHLTAAIAPTLDPRHPFAPPT